MKIKQIKRRRKLNEILKHQERNELWIWKKQVTNQMTEINLNKIDGKMTMKCTIS